MASATTDYYATLEIDPKASQPQIREAYKRAALKHHPDRVAADSPERPKRTKKFQKINDAYYTLSDPVRRRDYDDARRYNHSSTASAAFDDDDDDDDADEAPRPYAASGGGGGGFPWGAFGFGGGARAQQQHAAYQDEQFGSAFEEMLREQGMADEASKPTGTFWAILGGISGGVLGFIVMGLPGTLVGALGGNRLGRIRDVRGKSVYAVYQELPLEGKTKILAELAAKVFAHAVGS